MFTSCRRRKTVAPRWAQLITVSGNSPITIHSGVWCTMHVGESILHKSWASSIDEATDIRVAPSTSVISDTIDLLGDGKMVGWFDGGSELGPRALGQRSILCDPRRSDAKEILNRRVKMREAFRPFGPAILLEEAGNWFEFDHTMPDSPFMLRVCKVKADRRNEVPAIVHVDGTGRLRTVTREANGRFSELLRRFYEETGVPMLLNTSFNVMGQPTVETLADAIACLLNSGLDCCVFEDRIVFKE